MIGLIFGAAIGAIGYAMDALPPWAIAIGGAVGGLVECGVWACGQPGDGE